MIKRKPNNIYEGCIDNKEVFYRKYDTSWDSQLDIKRKHYEKLGYKVVFVFAANSFQDAARVVLYNKNQEIPRNMQEYKCKYVRINEHWAIESYLGICDKCGNYEPLICSCEYGDLCEDCSEDLDW